MKKQPRLFPVFVALCLFLVSGPLPAAAQMRVQVGAGASAGIPIVPAGSIMPSAGALSNSQTTLGLNAALAAPSLTPSPLVSVVPTAALQAPAALTIVMQPAAATPANAIVVPTPGGAASHIAQEAAAYAEVPAANAPAAKVQAEASPVAKSLAVRILDTLLRRPAASISFDGAAEKSAPIFSRMGLK